MEYIENEFVKSQEDIQKNIETIEAYLNPYGYKDKQIFAANLIKNGTCFIAYKVSEEIRFAPSRFVGYAENSMEKHESNDYKDGRDTNEVINRVLGFAPIEDAELEADYLKYCNKLFITPRAKGAFGAKRKYWRMV